MHNNNKLWLDELKSTYPESFENVKVLEIGSKDWNGTIRSWFYNCDYTGIDVDNGPGVDIVSEAKKFSSPKRFDVIVSFSVLEHDFQWQESLKNILNYLNDGGLLIMTWGAEGNLEHNNPWRPVPHKEVLEFLKNQGLTILDSFFEEDKYGKDCAGSYNIVATRDIRKDITKLINSLYDEQYSYTHSIDDIIRIMKQNNVYYFFHKDGNDIVGMICLHVVELLSRKVGVIEETVVLKEYRNKGIASELLKRALNKAEELKVTCVELNVKEDKKYVQEFYIKHGFYNRVNVAMRKWINKR